MQSLSSQVLDKSEVSPFDPSERPEAVVQDDIDDDDADTARFRNYVLSREISHDYVEKYRKEHCEMYWLCLMVFGDSGTGKTRLINQLLNKPYSDSSKGKLQVLNCIISGTDTTNLTWATPGNTFSERVKHHDSNSLEVKIWDVSFDWGAHNSHKVFLTPSSVCLLVLNVGQGLNTPVSDNERQMTPLESLDHWLQMIDMCTMHDKSEHHSECTIIALTHSDLIEESHREENIEEFKTEIKEHIQSKYTCKYVDPTIFVVDNSEMTMTELRKVIIDKGKSRLCGFKKKMPLLWLKLKSDIDMFCEENGQRHMSLHQVIFHAEASYGMYVEDLNDFLALHLQYRSLLFDPSALDGLENIYCNTFSRKSCLLITDPCFLDDAFEDLIYLWKNRVFPRSPSSSFKHTKEMNLDFKRNLISLETLTHLWADLDVKKVEALATVFVRFHLLIPDTSPKPLIKTKKYFVPGLVQSLTGIEVANSLEVFGNLTPLIYWFDRPCDPEYREISGFSTGVFFCKLVTVLKHINSKQGTWKLQRMSSDIAIFRVGPQGQVFAYIYTRACAIVVKLACLPNSMPDKPGNLIQDVRYWVEKGIRANIQDVVPALHCSVCVSPCGDEFTFDCLETLGGLGFVADNLPFAVCETHDAKYLDPSEFNRWFCPDTGMHNARRQSFMEKQVQKDSRTLKKLADRVGSKSTLVALALALHVPHEKVERSMQNNSKDIAAAALDVLIKDWYNKVPGTLLEGTEKYNALQEAKEEADLTVYV